MMAMHFILILLFVMVCILPAMAEINGQIINSIGVKLIAIKAGSFEMGVDTAPLTPELLKGARGVNYDRLTGEGDYDESPVHRVTISRAFFISETEITLEQFRQFKPEFKGNKAWWPYATGMSWHDAAAFCRWLSEKEGKTYRLPTEAEWEYVCRAGTRTPFSSGMQPLEMGIANSWGVKNMHAGPVEWCWDWHAMYCETEQVDPVGPEHGTTKVIRGGGLDYRKPKPENDTGRFMPAELAYFRRSANRASAAPSFSSADGHIGFRIVQAPMPASKPAAAELRMFTMAIEQKPFEVSASIDARKPHYRTRELFPNLGDRDMRQVGWKIGLPPGLGIAYHNSAIAMCPNGDLVAAYYNTTKYEDDPEQTILTMRLRRGASEWDFPEPRPDFADSADAAPVFWNDGKGKLWFFFGHPNLLGGPPFFFMTSTDSGASWSDVQMPHLVGPVGEFTSQPINSVLRDRDGTIYLAVDGDGADSVLFATDDEGKTWRDTGGRTAGRHTSFVMGKDGKTIIGFGGKNSNIDGFMPMSVSRDGGKTYENSATQFMPLASGQRPSAIRLLSGKIFFVADTLSSKVPGGRSASYVALSDDEGKTWWRKDLPIASTVGYVTATQSPDGMIHIATSKTKPAALHIEINEAWILCDEPSPAKEFVDELSGQLQSIDARGTKRWKCDFKNGKKVGEEMLWNEAGEICWRRVHEPDGRWAWKVFNRQSEVTSESHWAGKSLIHYKIQD